MIVPRVAQSLRDHPLDLPVRPGMVELGEAMLDAIFLAAHREHVGHVSRGGALSVARRIAELDAVVGQDRMDLVGNGLDQGDQEGGRRDPVRLRDELGEGELRGSIDRNIQMQLAFRRLHLSDVDMEEADRVALELPLGRLVALDIRQPADAMALQTAVQRRARQMRDCRL